MQSNPTAISKSGASSLSAAIHYRQPGDLRPWPGNPRVHSDKQVSKIAASIREFGFTMPVLIDEEDSILVGHGRCQAAQKMGIEVPTRVITGLTKAKKHALVLADNKLGLESKWDDTLLAKQLQILLEVPEFNIELTGFSTAEIDLITDRAPEPLRNDPGDLQPEDVVTHPVSRCGDLWKLNSHYLLCGDSLNPLSYDAVMQGAKAQMVITDPPYNVPINGHVGGNGKIKHKEFAMASGEMSPEEFVVFLKTGCLRIREVMQEGAVCYLFMDWRHIRELQEAAESIFGPSLQLCVWVKENGGMGTFYRSQHELVFVFKKGKAPHINNFELGQHGRYRTNVWNYPGVNTFKGKDRGLLALHPTVKPVSMIADAMRDCSHRKGIVLDPFAGSGTVLIAAERTGRHARAIELDPQYVDVGIARWQRVTGKPAILKATGQTWEQVRDERLAVKA